MPATGEIEILKVLNGFQSSSPGGAAKCRSTFRVANSCGNFSGFRSIEWGFGHSGSRSRCFLEKKTHTNCNISSEFDKCWLLCSFSFSHLQLTLKRLDCCLGIAKGSVGWSNTPLGPRGPRHFGVGALEEKNGDLFRKGRDRWDLNTNRKTTHTHKRLAQLDGVCCVCLFFQMNSFAGH